MLKKIIIKVLIQFIILEGLSALHGKIVFYDGTYVVGKVKKVDESSVHIIPIGLDTPEGVLVGNIDSLKMENGMVPVISSSVKYFYQNGEFLSNNDDWMDEYDDFQYGDYSTLQQPYEYQQKEKSIQQFYRLSVFGGVPFATAVSLQEEGGSFKMNPNFGFSFQMPYYEYGALDISPGIKIMNYSFDVSHAGYVQALQFSPFFDFDFKPVFYFLPKNLHLNALVGLSYNIGYDLDQNPTNYPNLEFDDLDLNNETYSGVGLNAGASFDYWFENLPIAIKFFANGNAIPQAPPYTNISTFFSNVGISIVVALKRHDFENSRPK